MKTLHILSSSTLLPIREDGLGLNNNATHTSPNLASTPREPEAFGRELSVSTASARPDANSAHQQSGAECQVLRDTSDQTVKGNFCISVGEQVI